MKMFMEILMFLVTLFVVFVLPIGAIVWIIYRLAKGSGGNNSITGD